MNSITTPRQLLEDQIRDLYSAEMQVCRTMPELVAHASHPDLKDFLSSLEDMCFRHTHRLHMAAEHLGSDPGGDECVAVSELIGECDRSITLARGPTMTSLMLLAHVSRLIHYKISGYGFATPLAEHLELLEPMGLLFASLHEELEHAEILAGLELRLFNTIGEGGRA